MKLNDMMRAQHVKRFHIVNTTKSQSVAEHSFNVALIARAIAIKMGFDSENIDNQYVLIHFLQNQLILDKQMGLGGPIG